MKRIISLILILALVVSLCACGQKAEEPATWQEQYDLGVRCLSEGNYEQAILAFEAAIEIDPKQADAYIALAEVYTARGDTEKAAEILEQAIDAIGETDVLTAALETLASASGPAQEPTLETSVPPDQDLSRTEREEWGSGYLIKEYDSAGNLVKKTSCDADGTVKDIVEYDTDGNRVRYTVCYSDGTVRFIYEYDTAGNEVRTTVYANDGTMNYYVINEYDTAGKKVKETYYDTDGTLARYCSYEYDAADNLVKETSYNADGTTDYYRTYEYDAAGNILEDVWYNGDGTTVRRWVYEYNAAGDLVKETHFDADGNITDQYEY